MKPHPRIRKTIKWGGAVVTVLLVVVWITSTRWYFAYQHDRRDFHIPRGEIMVVYWKPNASHVFINPGFHAIPADAMPQLSAWMPRWGNSSVGWAFSLPLWIPTLMSAAVAFAAWCMDTLARRRARLNLCPKCRYDRTGLAMSAVCPECGAVSPVKP